MKLTIDRAMLIKPLGHVQSVVERRNTIPVLSNVVLKAEHGQLSLTATDMDMDIVETVAAAVIEPGVITTPAQLLYEIVRKLPDGAEVEIAEAGEGQVKISAGRSSFNLPTLPVDDFPAISDAGMATEFTIAAAELKALIENTRFAVSTEETRYYLNGIYLHLADGHMLRAVSTDGHRLARSQMDMPAKAEMMPAVIVPRKAVGEMSKLIDEFEGDVNIGLSDTRARFSFGTIEVTTKLIDGTFPDYQRVIPTENNHIMRVSVSNFKESVDRVSTISAEKSRSVKMRLEGGVLTLFASSPDAANATEAVEVEYTGPELEIGFNARYLLDIAAQIDGDMMEFALSDASAPTIISAPGDDANLFVLMPMRV
ncbi:MAG: DNA polymerase III subunit beta [Alphaproteobacteria bacterium]|nr:DNA polymerase III subunit beta [Alphaproteobacteria bacterium]